MAKKKTPQCPCQSGKNYQDCCQPIHDGTADAETAEKLMRSRYSAYALGLVEYLLASWHPSTRPPILQLDENCKWIGLRINATKRGEIEDIEGWVDFEARYKINGKAEKLKENSYFRRVDGKWLYISGEQQLVD